MLNMLTSRSLPILAAIGLSLTALLTANEPTKLVIALKPDKNPEAMAMERVALAAALRPSVGREVEVIIPLSAAVITEGMANGTVDAGWLASTDVAKLKAPRTAQILLASVIKGKTTYESMWLVRADAPFQSIADMKGKSVAFASKTSTSGGIIPLYDLVQRGLVPAGGSPTAFFGEGNVWFGTGYVSAVDRVLANQADAAAVSDYVFEGDKHLKPEQKAKLRVLQRQGPVPTHVLAVRSTLSEKERTNLKAALASLAAPLRDAVFSGPLVEVEESEHLKPISAALATAQALKL